jgi:hypothetical protein
MHKTSVYVSSLVLLFVGIMAKVRAQMDKQVPVGYQDESGFHVGEKKSKENWPPFW